MNISLRLFLKLAFLFYVLARCTALIDIFQHDDRCKVSDDPDLTVYNLNMYCDYKQLSELFTSLPAGPFPPTKRVLKGHALLCPGTGCAVVEQLAQVMWAGKMFLKSEGKSPNEKGYVINHVLGSLQLFYGDVRRENAPFDNKPSWVLDYKNDVLGFWVKDYIRQVGPNLYLGIKTTRVTTTVPNLFFMLEVKPH